MIFSNYENPCHKDCPDRKGGCKMTCEKPEYKAYREAQEKARAAKDRERMLDSYFRDKKRRR